MNVRGLMMQARDIDSDGVWNNNGRPVALLGADLPIPENLRESYEPERQEVLMLFDVSDILKKCPSCGVKAEGIILVTQYAKMYPAHCCDKIVWMTEGEEEDGGE